MEKYSYIKFENGEIKLLPINDPNGKVVPGKHIINLKEWMDENPEERKKLGWIKQIHRDPKEIVYNKQTQYLQRYSRQIDPYTIQDEYIVVDKAEEMMLLAEMMETLNYGGAIFSNMGIVDFGG